MFIVRPSSNMIAGNVAVGYPMQVDEAVMRAYEVVVMGGGGWGWGLYLITVAYLGRKDARWMTQR